MKLLKPCLSSSAIVLSAALLLSATSAFADSYTVYVAYADNLRPSGFFPTPWLGASNVVSETPVGQSLDTGAVMIVNTGATTLNITGFNVHFGTGQNFNFWSPLSLAPGQDGIFTQTGSYNFDTSDFGTFGGAPPLNLAPDNYLGNGDFSGIGGCSSPTALMTSAQLAQCNAAIPTISFIVNGAPTASFNDSGHILDTGGYDFINASAYGSDGNESINWNVVGTVANRGGTPEPGYYGLVGLGLAGFFAARRKRAVKP